MESTTVRPVLARLPVDLIDALDRAAKQERRSRNAQIEEVLSDWLAARASAAGSRPIKPEGKPA